MLREEVPGVKREPSPAPQRCAPQPGAASRQRARPLRCARGRDGRDHRHHRATTQAAPDSGIKPYGDWHDGGVGRRRRNRKSQLDPQLPGSFRRTLERWERLRPIIEGGADPSVEIESRVNELERIFAPYDAIHMLGQFAGSEWALRRPDEYVESEEPGAAYA
jgi:hypothetical protein